jgi:hypothetical protein
MPLPCRRWSDSNNIRDLDSIDRSRTQALIQTNRGLTHESRMDQHQILPVPEDFRISIDRSVGSHLIGSSRGGNSSKHCPVKRKRSADPGTGRVVALHRDHTGIHLPGD